MASEQPYRPPRADTSGRAATGAGGSITPNMVQSLLGTRRWVLLMGVMGMIGTVLMGLLGLVFVVGGGVAGISDLGGLGGAALGGVYLLMGFLYFFPSLFLIRYGGAIKRMGGRANSPAIEDALQQQLSFWRFVGIFTTVVLSLYAVIIVVAMVAAIAVPLMGS
jgi:hypothetical protein